jgi:hypothetical protein
LVAALTLAAVGLLIGAGATGLRDRSSGDRSAPAQVERFLPPPPSTASELQTVGEDAPEAPASWTKPTSGRAPAAVDRELPPPVRIVIPAIRVSARVVPLGLNPDRTLQVPSNFADAGWFVGGPEPGERGAAIIVGHVDSRSGPAVFYRLRALLRGDVIRVVLRGGRVVRFAVRGMKAFPKNRFPTRLVYGQTRGPTLRLITCDGRFDQTTGHYVDNYIVFASRIP